MADQLPLQEPLIQFLPGKIRLVLLPVAVGDLAEALGTGKRHVRRKVPQIPRDGYVPAAAVCPLQPYDVPCGDGAGLHLSRDDSAPACDAEHVLHRDAEGLSGAISVARAAPAAAIQFLIPAPVPVVCAVRFVFLPEYIQQSHLRSLLFSVPESGLQPCCISYFGYILSIFQLSFQPVAH